MGSIAGKGPKGLVKHPRIHISTLLLLLHVYHVRIRLPRS